MYKLIAIDMDDTLLNDQGEISAGNMSALEEAVAKGIKIIFCSGRPYKGLLPFIKKLKLNQKGNYAISLNGAQIYDLYKNEIIGEQTFDKKYFFEIYNIAKPYDVDIQVYIGKNILVEKKSSKIAAYMKKMDITPIQVNSLEQYIDEDMAKVLLLGENSVLKEIEKKCLLDLNIYMSRPMFLEFVSKRINKGAAMLKVAKMFGIPKEATIAVGDSYNDVQMLQSAGLAIAMKNGVEALKETAGYITKNDNNHDGIKEIIETFILAL